MQMQKRIGGLGGGVSLVVPLQDEERTVEELLRSISSQTLLPDELVLVDAGSRDATVIRAGTLQLQVPTRVIAVGRVHPGVARNAGVAATTSSWLAFTDAGVVLDKRWLAELAVQARAGADVVWGAYEPVCDTFFRECAAVAYVPPRGNQGTRGPSIASCLLRRSVFDAVGGFTPHRAAEDLIFISRLAAQPIRPAFAPGAIAQWEITGTFRAVFARFATYSYHNLLASWGRHWHLGTARLYLALISSIVAATGLGGGAWAWLLVPAFFIGRAAKAAWVKRGSLGFTTVWPWRVLGAAAVLVVIDAATAVGFGRWLLTRVRH